MRIDHIAIYTKKLDRLKSFYEYYFGGISNTKYKNNENTDFPLTILNIQNF